MVGMARSVKLIMYCEIASSSSVSPFFISCGRHQEISGGDARARSLTLLRKEALTTPNIRPQQGAQPPVFGPTTQSLTLKGVHCI